MSPEARTEADEYVNWSAELVTDVPTGVVTVTSTVPAPAGATAVSEVGEMTVTPVARGRAEVDGGGAGQVGAGHRDHRALRPGDLSG